MFLHRTRVVSSVFRTSAGCIHFTGKGNRDSMFLLRNLWDRVGVGVSVRVSVRVRVRVRVNLFCNSPSLNGKA